MPTDPADLLRQRGYRVTGPRHQTLRTTIEWSHDLLADGERAVLRRSCVFAGRFTLDDVEPVCTSGDAPAAQALDLLSSLVDKSLVMKEDANGLACYRLHETMREFAGLKLAEAGEEEAVEPRCAEHYRSTGGLSALEGRYRLLEWFEWADLEIDNVRAVLQRCLSRADAVRGIDLAANLGWYWVTRATSEGMRWLDEFLALEGGSLDTRAWAYFIRGFLAVLKADPVSAKPALQAAMATARQAGQRDALTEALSMASIAEGITGDRATAGRLLDEAQGTASPAYPAGMLPTSCRSLLRCWTRPGSRPPRCWGQRGSRPSLRPKSPGPGCGIGARAGRASPGCRRGLRPGRRRAARQTGSRGRAAGRRRPDQQADRGAPVHIRAHR